MSRTLKRRVIESVDESEMSCGIPQASANRITVDTLYMQADITSGHTLGVHADHLLLDTRYIPLAFLYNLRIKRTGFGPVGDPAQYSPNAI